MPRQVSVGLTCMRTADPTARGAVEVAVSGPVLLWDWPGHRLSVVVGSANALRLSEGIGCEESQC